MTAMRTAGRSVLVAGVTVVIGMLGLLILRQSLLNGVAVAAAATVAMVLLASLTLLPALPGFSGTRLARPSRVKPPKWMRGATVRSGKPGLPAAERWAGVIQRRPVAAAVSGAFILVLAAPALGMKLSFPDESAQARGTMGYASYATMAQGFGPGFDAPVIIAAKLPGPHAGTARLAAAIAATPGVAALTPVVVSRDGQAAMLIAYPATGEQDPATDTLVNRIHDTVLPQATAGTGISAYVTGPNAGNVSFANLIGQRLPWLIGVVFLLSRIREEYDSCGDNAAAVARGLSRTARVITAAAAIMVAVFLSIVIAPNVSTKQIGLGLAVAILIDATVVRLVLVPAVMELLGRANWWLPGWLDRLLPKTSLSEDEPPAGPPAAVPATR